MSLVTFQQIIVETRLDLFTNTVNELLMDGWRVVPGTFDIKSCEEIAPPTLPGHFVTVKGTAYFKKHFITLERTEEKVS